jgi:hypothetical protein
MVRKTIVALSLFAMLASCNSTRPFLVCLIVEETGHCAKEDVQSLIPVAEMNDFTAWDEIANDHVAERLQECKQFGKLPRNDITWIEMRTCVIGTDCPDDLDGMFATDPRGARALQAKLDWCRRQ